MDVTNIASVATSLSNANANANQTVSTAVLKKAVDVSAEGALVLIQALPGNQSTQNLPSKLGKNINTTT